MGELARARLVVLRVATTALLMFSGWLPRVKRALEQVDIKQTSKRETVVMKSRWGGGRGEKKRRRKKRDEDGGRLGELQARLAVSGHLISSPIRPLDWQRGRSRACVGLLQGAPNVRNWLDWVGWGELGGDFPE